MHASVKAVEELDKIIEKTIEFCKNNNIKLFITADH
jgi:bisphosphoglycerate-independent phosphoglycerate mutase (AlkP superfamily)